MSIGQSCLDQFYYNFSRRQPASNLWNPRGPLKNKILSFTIAAAAAAANAEVMHVMNSHAFLQMDHEYCVVLDLVYKQYISLCITSIQMLIPH